MLKHSVRPRSFALILGLSGFCLISAIWLVVNHGDDNQTDSYNSSDEAIAVDGDTAQSLENAVRRSDPEGESASAVPDIRQRDDDSVSEILSLFGLSSEGSDNSESLEDIYIDAEMDAPHDGDAAWRAATIRRQCDFSAGVTASDEDIPDIYEAISEQCSLLEQTSVYQKWELVEFGAVNGNVDAIVAQLSFPPPPGALQGKEGPLTAEEWNNLVFNRVRKAADGGHPGAMLKTAEIYAGLHHGETDYALAEDYLERLSHVPDLTPYQKSMALNLLKLTRKSRNERE